MPFPFTFGGSSGGGGGETTPPVISNMTPAPGALLPGQFIEFDVTDETGLARVLITASFAHLDAPELVHDGSSFTPAYAQASSRSAISGGYHFKVLRKRQWPGGVSLAAYAIDTSGNESA